jgi:TPR repeat protein
MKYLHRLLFIFTLITPLFAQDPLWDAIEAWEQGDNKRAAILFEKFKRGNPVARPYIKDLISRKFLTDDSLHEDFECSKFNTNAECWFETSKLVRELLNPKQSIKGSKSKDLQKKEKKRAKALKTLLALETPAACYARAKLAECGKIAEKDTKAYSAAQYKKSFQVMGEGCIDLRCLLELEASPQYVVLNRVVNMSKLIPQIKEQLKVQSMGNVLYGLSQSIQETTVSTLFRRSAAYLGSVEAQIEMAQSHSTSLLEGLCWFSQAAEQDHPKGLDFLAYQFEHGVIIARDPKKCMFYSERALEMNENHEPLIYYNHAFRLEALGQLDEADQLYQKALDHGADAKAQHSIAKHFINRGNLEKAKQILFALGKTGYLSAVEDYTVIATDAAGFEELIPVCLAAPREDENAVSLCTRMFVRTSDEVRQKFKKPIFERLKVNILSKNPEVKKVAAYEAGVFLRAFNFDKVLVGDPFKYFTMASKLGSAEADYELGNCYKDGIGVEANQALAIEAYERSIRAGVKLGLNSAGLLLMNLNDRALDVKALEYLQRAYKEVPEIREAAAFNLGLMHKSGRGGAAEDPVLVEKYFREAAEDPSFRVDAHYELARYLANLDPNNLMVATELLEEGVRLEDLPSLSIYGQLLLYNPASNENKELRKRGVQCILQAANLKLSPARAVFAMLTLTGVEGVLKKNPDKVKLYLSHFSEQEVELFNELVENYILQFAVKLLEYRVSREELQQAVEVEPESSESDEEPIVEEMPALEGVPEAKETQIVDPKVARLQARIEELQGKKQVKWRKVRGLMGQVMNLSSGNVAPGRGSGQRIEMGDRTTVVHIPHGSDSSETDAGRVNTLQTLMKAAVEKKKNKILDINNSNN